MAIRPFVGVDGEGGNVTDLYGFTTHDYTMLRIGDRYTEGPDWLRFISTAGKKQLLVAFMFDYDVTMMCRTMDEQNLRLLVSGSEAHAGPYTLQYRPRKEFIVRGHGNYVTVNDVFTFFQCKFVTALERWEIGTSDQMAMIADGKEMRHDFGYLTTKTIEYNALECVLLAELMEKFRRACTAINYLPRKWQGPGQLAKAMLRTHGIPETEKLPEPNLAGVWEAAQASYYGGRFETSAAGPIKGPIEGWDINSAYPHAITKLPCLSHVRWHPSKTIEPEGLYHVKYTHRKDLMWHGLPYRTHNGSILFPRSAGGWYWGFELLSAMRLGAKITVTSGFRLERECAHIPFNFLERLYSVRKAIGKSTAGLALKLAMNSVYGVLAQSVGKAPYANPVYASYITALTRSRLTDALAMSPQDVYMVATDGIYTAGGFPLEPSGELGGWDKSEYPHMHIVMPGVYFAGDQASRTRGVPYSAVAAHRDELISAYRGSPNDHVLLPLRQFIGLRSAVARNRLELAGQWIDEQHLISYNWRTKRRDTVYPSDIGDRTRPYPGGDDWESTVYKRLIGGNQLRHLDYLTISDSPDWADTLTEI